MATARSGLIPAISYRDPRAALDFLQKAFGFEIAMLIEDADGKVAHSEMRHGDSLVMIGAEWSEEHRSPSSLGGKNTQSVHIDIDTDVDAHCARRAAGAEIWMEPADQFYGARSYRCRDPEGHIWTVSRMERDVSNEEMERASGLKIAAMT